MRNNLFSLEGKTILIVGGSRGIGRATAIQCANMGGTIIDLARNPKTLQNVIDSLEGESHRYFSVDITDAEAVNAILPELPMVDGVVLCAGIGAMKPFVFCSRADYDRVFNLNFFAIVDFLRLLVKKKKLNKGASVVFVSSIGGVCNYSEGNSIYGASKAAINSTMKFCAIEFAPKKIRVNSVNPGMINTEFNNPDILTEEQLKKDIEKYPLRRFGEPEDVANAIVYLLSDASSWVTGTSLIIDGGYTVK